MARAFLSQHLKNSSPEKEMTRERGDEEKGKGSYDHKWLSKAPGLQDGPQIPAVDEVEVNRRNRRIPPGFASKPRNRSTKQRGDSLNKNCDVTQI
jgi:hypothetical protein